MINTHKMGFELAQDWIVAAARRLVQYDRLAGWQDGSPTIETIEPDAWQVNGGDAASIRYYQGTLIVRAPDYIQRQLGGYPFVVRPMSSSMSSGNGPRELKPAMMSATAGSDTAGSPGVIVPA